MSLDLPASLADSDVAIHRDVGPLSGPHVLALAVRAHALDRITALDQEIDGQLSAGRVRDQVAVVMQEPTRWPLSARDNIGIGHFGGGNLTTGNSNIAIGNAGVPLDSHRPRGGIRLDSQANEGHAAMAGQGFALLTPFLWRGDVAAVRPLQLGAGALLVREQWASENAEPVHAVGRPQRVLVRAGQLGLQRLDLMADGSLRHEQLLGRARKALVAGGGLEGAQRGKRRKASYHG